MKRTLKIAALVMVSFIILWACGGEKGAKAVGEAFLLAVAKGDLVTAKSLSTKESEKSLNMMSAVAEGKKANPDKIEIVNCKEDGDKATLNYKENGKEKTLDLVKLNGQWKASWSKGGGFGDAAEIAEEDTHPELSNDSLSEDSSASAKGK